MKSKKLISVLIASCLFMGVSIPSVFAKNNTREVDLYEAFSNKKDIEKTEVGSRIYNWSMYLPEDAVTYKSDKANYFHMSSENYNASISLDITKNETNMSLQEALFNLEISKKLDTESNTANDLNVSIARDKNNEKFIKVIKIEESYDYETDEESKDYIENRIYVTDKYIYNLSVDMNDEFYSKHKEMFNKLTSSFKLSYNGKNPHIKELSDSINTPREFDNKIYGWSITVSPYWKQLTDESLKSQIFKPVYNNNELEQTKLLPSDKEEDTDNKESISVNLIGSSNDETATFWGRKDKQEFSKTYNTNIYKFIQEKSINLNGKDVYSIEYLDESMIGKPFIVKNIYVIANGYKYIIYGRISKEDYDDSVKKNRFEDMIKSIKFNKNNLNKYLGKLTSIDSISNLNATKTISVQKDNFTVVTDSTWLNTDLSYDLTTGSFETRDLSLLKNTMYNLRSKVLFDPLNNITLAFSTHLQVKKFNEIVKNQIQEFLNGSKLQSGINKVTIQSSKTKDAEIYYIRNEYNLDALKSIVEKDPTKNYNLNKLTNSYQYIIKVGQDFYYETAQLPLINLTDVNLDKIKNAWRNTTIKGVNYSKLDLKWENHDIKEFNTNDTSTKSKAEQLLQLLQ